MIYKKIGEAERLERHLAVLRNKGQDVERGSFGESDNKSYSDRFRRCSSQSCEDSGG